MENLTVINYLNSDDILYRYSDNIILIELNLNSKNDILQLVKFYRNNYNIDINNKGKGKENLMNIIDYLLKNSHIGMKTKFILESEENPNRNIIRYYKSLGFKTDKREYIDMYGFKQVYFIKMKTTIKIVLGKTKTI